MDQQSEHASPVRTRSIRFLLLALSALTLANAPVETYQLLGLGRWLPLAVVALGLLLPGLWLTPERAWLRVLGTLSLGGWVAGTLYEHLDDPSRGLYLLLLTVMITFFLWPSRQLEWRGQERKHQAEWDILMIAAVASWSGLEQLRLSELLLVQAAAQSLLYCIPILLTLRSPAYRSPLHRAFFGCVAVFALFPLAAGLQMQLLERGGAFGSYGLLSPLLLVLLISLQVLFRRRPTFLAPREQGFFDAVLEHPARVLVLSFLMICLLGTLLLSLPVASATGKPLHWLDAAFTAVSATCVTGLIVVDTPNAFGALGQLFVLSLIQIGGLGIMVFSASAFILLGERLSLSHERAAVEIVGAKGRNDLVQAVRAIFLVTFVTEALAAFLLFCGFLLRGVAPGEAAWHAVFTSISAFCNAGFALKSDSLMSYAGDPFVLGVISLTIIIGGLGPPVVVALLASGTKKRWTLHVRLVLWSTLILLLVPALLFLLIEWNHTLAKMSLLHKLNNAFFQSVTLRTAGFNSVDLAQVHPATWTMMVLVMFIGGSPGSTAGGIKTTTMAVVFLAIVVVVRGRDRVELFGRTIPLLTVLRATAITSLAVFGSLLALFTLLLTQTIPLRAAIFEVISALATVGLSIGATGQLDDVGKLIIIACMFAGRVGLFTLFVFLTNKVSMSRAYHYPEEHVPIG